MGDEDVVETGEEAPHEEEGGSNAHGADVGAFEAGVLREASGSGAEYGHRISLRELKKTERVRFRAATRGALSGDARRAFLTLTMLHRIRRACPRTGPRGGSYQLTKTGPAWKMELPNPSYDVLRPGGAALIDQFVFRPGRLHDAMFTQAWKFLHGRFQRAVLRFSGDLRDFEGCCDASRGPVVLSLWCWTFFGSSRCGDAVVLARLRDAARGTSWCRLQTRYDGMGIAAGTGISRRDFLLRVGAGGWV